MRRPVLTVCVALGVLFLIGLGAWQVARLQWKLDLIERTEARVNAPPVPVAEVWGGDANAVEYAPVSVSGGFPTDRVAHVFGTHLGHPGWYAFQPILLDTPLGGDRYLLFNRGFVPQDERAPSYPLPEDGQITGLVRVFEGGGGVAGLVAAPADQGEGSYFDRRFETLSAAFPGLEPDRFVRGFYLDSTMPTELPRGGTTRLDFSNRHLGYAITWFGLAGGLLAVYVAMMRRR